VRVVYGIGVEEFTIEGSPCLEAVLGQRGLLWLIERPQKLVSILNIEKLFSMEHK
jgi:hypothetical protein